jgi:hypothetical protein
MASFDIDNESIIIPSSKYKLAGLILMTATFAAVGVFMLLNAKEIAGTEYHRRPVFSVITIDIIGAAFGGIGFILFVYQLLRSSKPGLIVNFDGIYDNSTLLSAGLIRWDEITDIKESDQAGYINIFVKNPEEHIDRLRNPVKKRAVKAVFNKNGTPISISQDTLKCEYNELWSLLTTPLFEYQQAKKATHFNGAI